MDYKTINKSSIKITEVLMEGKTYFNDIYEKTKIKSKNNLLKNLDLLVLNKVLIKEKNKSNTFYSINYLNELSIAILNLINKIKFEKIPFIIRKSIFDSVFALKPRLAILFGSYAKGDYTRESDIDLIFFDSIEEKKEKIMKISKNYGIQINITFMKLKDLSLNSESIKHVFKTGYPVIGEEYFYNEAKKI